MSELARFILEEMKRRKIESEREFAKFINVAPSTLNLHVNEATRENNDPSLMFLRHLSKATGVPLPRILAIAFPREKDELGLETEPEPLSEDERRLLTAYRDWDLATAAMLFAERATALVQEALGKDAIDAIVKKARRE